MIVALAQLCSTPQLDKNMERIATLARQAKERGTQWVLFPECAPYLGPNPLDDGALQTRDGEIVTTMQALAKELSMHITLGSYHEQSSHPQKAFNTQVHIDAEGQIITAYQKLHLFDVTFADGSALRESDSYVAGNEVVTHTLNTEQHHWVVGSSICYDLRFPYLYQKLVQRGAEIITAPSAFTLETGREHWHALLRARAIETQSYVLAPNQWGNHFGPRHSYGQSAIYDPWGRLLACAPDKECVITAELDISLLQRVRQRLPCQQHKRTDMEW